MTRTYTWHLAVVVPVALVAVGVAVERPAPRATASGARSGVLLAGATGASIVAAYVFLLAAAKQSLREMFPRMVGGQVAEGGEMDFEGSDIWDSEIHRAMSLVAFSLVW